MALSCIYLKYFANPTANFKIISHWYLTPHPLVCITPTADDKCWRGCEGIGNYRQSWLDCPIVYSFWTTFFKKIKQILGIAWELNPNLILLNYSFYNLEGQTLSVLLSAARSVVAQTWKNPTPIPITLWYSKTWTFYRIAKITNYHTEGRAQENFLAVWYPIMSFLASQKEISFDRK